MINHLIVVNHCFNLFSKQTRNYKVMDRTQKRDRRTDNLATICSPEFPIREHKKKILSCQWPKRSLPDFSGMVKSEFCNINFKLSIDIDWLCGKPALLNWGKDHSSAIELCIAIIFHSFYVHVPWHLLFQMTSWCEFQYVSGSALHLMPLTLLLKPIDV